MKPTYGSLFSGVGGFDMGLDQAGYDCMFQVEWDKHCQTVLNRHWSEVPKWSNVQDVNGAEIPPCDVLIFGSPCQDLSVAGKRAGLDGGRSSMFFEATRIIKEMRNATNGTYPRIAVWENVPGALTSNRGADFGAVLQEMADCGSLLTEWAVLDAQHFGVPQRRRRIFLVAVLDPATASRCPDPLFPVAEGRRGDYSKGVKEGQEIARTLGSSLDGSSGSRDTDRMTFIPIQGTIIGRSDTAGPRGPGFGKHDDPMFTLETTSQHGVAQITDPVMTFTAQRVGEPPRIYEDSTPALLSRMGTGGNNTPMIAQTVSFGWQEQRYAGDTHEEVTTALTTTKTPAVMVTAPTLTAANNPSRSPQSTEVTQQVEAVFQASHAVRRLTPLECERLMGWPDDHTRWRADGTEQSDSARYKQCGNGVATPVARWVAQQIEAIL